MKEFSDFFLQHIGNVIKKHRQNKSMSGDKLGSVVGLSKSTISYYEHGQKPIPADTLAKISEALNIPLREYTEIRDSESGKKILLEDAYQINPDIEPIGVHNRVYKSTLKNMINFMNFAAPKGSPAHVDDRPPKPGIYFDKEKNVYYLAPRKERLKKVYSPPKPRDDEHFVKLINSERYGEIADILALINDFTNTSKVNQDYNKSRLFAKLIKSVLSCISSDDPELREYIEMCKVEKVDDNSKYNPEIKEKIVKKGQ